MKERPNYFLPIVVALFILSYIFIGPVACTQPQEAIRVLQSQGYTDVKITGWRPLAGDKGDYYSTGFVAKSPNGTVVSGAVTSGWFKGHTVRLD